MLMLVGQVLTAVPKKILLGVSKDKSFKFQIMRRDEF